MSKTFKVSLLLLVAVGPLFAKAQGPFDDARKFYRQGQYMRSAREAFRKTSDPKLKPEAYAWMTMGLMKSGLNQTAAFMYMRTLELQNRDAIRMVLPFTRELFERAGPDLLRKFLSKYTTAVDHTLDSRLSYEYSMAKADLLKGDYKGTIRQLAGVFEPAKSSSKLDGTYASIFLVRGTAKAISGDEFGAIEDFRSCQRLSRKLYDRFSGEDDTSSDSYKKIKKLKANEMLDTESRCIAGEGRVLYEAGKFDQAEKVYDTISKYSFVYTDILFEQGWNAYAKGEFNRTLGKLVSYNSPSLKFVLNSEVDVLRAQTYLEMCLYKDANDIAKAYPQTYQRLAELIKSVTNSYGTNMGQYFEMGRRNSGQALHADDPVHRLFNRFVRSPYFQTTLAAEKALTEERSAIDRFVRGPGNEKFNTFLKMVNDWRRNQVRQLGGSFIRNSMNDHYEVLISDLEKMGFIRLEILSRAKKSLMDLDKPVDQKVLARSRGMKEPKRRGDQMYFDFNGEFWNDEIGDYVFALDSECGKKEFEGNPLQ